MLNFFREEDYEKSLIELFQNDLENKIKKKWKNS